MKVLYCKHCKNLLIPAVNLKVTPYCCGEKMEELVPNVTDGALEKHVPFVEINANEVNIKIGEVLHPSLDAHYIEFILLETNKNKVYLKTLNPTDEPKATFILEEDEKAVAVYEYCNLHGFWKKDL